MTCHFLVTTGRCHSDVKMNVSADLGHVSREVARTETLDNTKYIMSILAQRILLYYLCHTHSSKTNIFPKSPRRQRS